ncbi:DUF3954 domain-containing protein [Oceanobacillus sojae]|uniref:DUF3954 domain-containing protein n=1 Tax=Oceanobacillus sojae TaxID=582851 RepID=UPI00363B93F1
MTTSKVEINLSEDKVLVVKGGKLKEYPKPDSGFGKQIINWNDGKICNEEIRYTVK